MPSYLVHSVLITFKPEASEEERQRAHKLYQTLDTECGGRAAGILLWKVDWNMDTRKGVHPCRVRCLHRQRRPPGLQGAPRPSGNLRTDEADCRLGGRRHYGRIPCCPL